MSSESYGMPSLTVEGSEWKASLQRLNKEKETRMDMLVCLSAVDRLEAGVEVYVHLRSTRTGKEMIVKTLVPIGGSIASLCSIWSGAELFEDEVYDLFGVGFTGHPFLRRIMMEEDFEGHPMLKLYGKVL